ncbi:concanavalin A-like lectin/glucanase domain-containing protein [Massariosphaeria phaeospora]|uniref:endo-1,3(4)-beta-glucanase n=1 Tax=Massariosphaeria phaeospora TaxID=100035 RepID=A0A7C8MC42_9PLEO|nr:concanavalin A-like lectin/glucanase domain-containing protein [Massariosphaeria phaeospora]
MHFSTFISGVALLQLSIAGYVLQDDYMNDFYGSFEFFTEADPTKGFVQYIGESEARELGLINSNNSKTASVEWGVETTKQTPEGRPSLRLESKKSYEHGLVVLDVQHMPFGCGTWPAFWMLGPDWPENGEIDILEGVHEETHNGITLHTGPGCAVESEAGGFSGSLDTPNCDVNAEGQSKNKGCTIKSPTEKSYGAGLNSNEGGVYATEWSNDAISVFFFPRGEVPDDALGDNPDPTAWGKPAAKFASTGCDIKGMFNDQKIIIDTTFCGEWAGNTWNTSTCASKAPTCNEYVRDNPEAFKEAYWTVNALRVYQENGEASVPGPEPTVVPTPEPSDIPTPSDTELPPAPTSNDPFPSIPAPAVPVPSNATFSPIAPPAPIPTNNSPPSIAPPETIPSQVPEAPAQPTLAPPAPLPTANATSPPPAPPAPPGSLPPGAGQSTRSPLKPSKPTHRTDSSIAQPTGSKPGSQGSGFQWPKGGGSKPKPNVPAQSSTRLATPSSAPSVSQASSPLNSAIASLVSLTTAAPDLPGPSGAVGVDAVATVWETVYVTVPAAAPVESPAASAAGVGAKRVRQVRQRRRRAMQHDARR